MLTNDVGARWTVVHKSSGPNDGPYVRRYPVPGGWLYQVSVDYIGGPVAWHAPTFVPAPPALAPDRAF
jgi:hypothetical protein